MIMKMIMSEQSGVGGGFPAASEPGSPCTLCPRLHGLITAQKTAKPEWHNGPVPSFGDPQARLLIVGLAPGLRGANQTGRPFTGDWAGDLLYASLSKFGFSSGTYGARPDDGVRLRDAAITNAVRCVPPQNKPVGAEIATCNAFLASLLANMPRVEIILALGRISHEAVLRALGKRQASHPFGHHALHELEGGANKRMLLVDSYHCSRYNTNTGRLTVAMFEAVFETIGTRLAKP